MDKKIGLWLDRNKAVIVSITDNVQARVIITSDMAHYLPYRNGSIEHEISEEGISDPRFWKHLSEYYEKIVLHIRDASEILIFGPASAKQELQQRLDGQGLGGLVVGFEDAGRMTDLEIATKVLKRFPLRSRFDMAH